MKKVVFFVALVVLLSLSACVPDFLNSGSQDAPAESIDIAATVDAGASTQVAQTFEALAALATPTIEDPVVEPTAEKATATETVLPSETPTLEATETPDGTEMADAMSLTPDGTLEPTATGTLEAAATSIYPSPTSPISVNQPPAYIPRYKIKVTNNTKVRVYISLQGVTEGGYHPITEYDLAPWEKTKFAIPEGQYTAVVYVGKDPMVAYFGIHGSNEITIVIEKDQIKVNK